VTTLLPIITSIIKVAIEAGSPLLAGTLGEIFTERSGVINLGVEGMMIMGAVSAFLFSQITANAWIGIMGAALIGGAMALIHAFMSVKLKVNQNISGLALAMLGSGLSSLIGQKYIGIPGYTLKPILFGLDALTIFFILLVPASWIILFKTKIGISIRSVGDNPEAAYSLGVNVYAIRYICTVIGGVLAGLAGAYLSLSYIPSWTENMTVGRGWIVLALTIFASWNPIHALIGSWLFGGIEAIQYRLQPLGISPSLLGTLPFIFTIIMLVIGTRERVRKRMGAPAALGKPFIEE